MGKIRQWRVFRSFCDPNATQAGRGNLELVSKTEYAFHLLLKTLTRAIIRISHEPVGPLD
jgi:hypothetical protein